MSELKILRGVPASGKTTEALSMDGFTRVSRDDLRFSMYGAHWGGGINEEVVTQAENAMIEGALREGENVVVDATNLNKRALRTKLSIASRYGAAVEFQDFPISLEDAVRRDRSRERTVGESVIRGFFRRYKINPESGVLPAPPDALPFFEEYVRDETKPKAFIVDTDGTVADHVGVRSPYDTSQYHLDKPHPHVVGVTRKIGYTFHVIGLSGRAEEFRSVTEGWWISHGLPFDMFLMRPTGDTRMDAIVKYELFKEHIEPNYNVLGAFDDRPQVIRMWRAIGLPVFDVGNGVEF